ncbi:MAG: tRNA (adenosine(37)-N6)-threonylcarbamoyltransferase complex dimerization subunit type 1 TsaB [Panacibacter sp.]
MALLLNIDTATEYGSVCFSRNETVLAMEETSDQKNHGSFVQPAIQNLMLTLNIQLGDIDAVVVTAGPGSYTGLRVGLSTAKGLCFALNKPLIMISTLEIMAYAALLKIKNSKAETKDLLFCPMIDARRSEVFTAIYDDQLNCIVNPSAVILPEIDSGFFPLNKKIIFSGNGSTKMQVANTPQKAIFINTQHNVGHLAVLGAGAFEKKEFADLAYSEPVYVKEFFNPTTHAKN